MSFAPLLLAALAPPAGGPPVDPAALLAALRHRDAALADARIEGLLVVRSPEHRLLGGGPDRSATAAGTEPGDRVAFGFSKVWAVPTGRFRFDVQRLTVVTAGGDAELRYEPADPADGRAASLRAMLPAGPGVPPGDGAAPPDGTLAPDDRPRAYRTGDGETDVSDAGVWREVRETRLRAGFGLAAALRAIETVEPAGTGVRLTGIAEPVPGVLEFVTAEVDADLLVRSAEFRPSGPASGRWERAASVVTAGVINTAAGVPVAARGSLVEVSRRRGGTAADTEVLHAAALAVTAVTPAVTPAGG